LGLLFCFFHFPIRASLLVGAVSAVHINSGCFIISSTRTPPQ
jgi:hypothetical protein